MRHIIRTRILAGIALIAVSFAAQLGQAQVYVHEGERLDAVVGVVGKYPIFKSAIDAQVQIMLLQRGLSTLPGDSMMKLRKQVLESEIDQKVMLAMSDKDSIVAAEAEVDDRIDEQIKLYVSRLGSEAAVQKQFGKSIAELKAAPELRDRARQSILIERERYKNVPPATSASKRDVEQFLSQYKDSLPTVPPQVELGTIVKLAKPQPGQTDASMKFAQSLIDSLDKGADFADLARRYSQHATAKSGGDLGGYFARGTFLPEFEEAAYKLKPGEHSSIVKSDQGFHIIKLLDRRGEEIHVAQILIKPSVSGTDEEVVRAELIAIRDSAIGGKDFGKLAQERSDDVDTKANFGLLGRVRVDELAPEQREVVDSLQVGQISMPLHIAYPGGIKGFQIVKLIKRVPAHKVSITEDYRDLEATAIQWKQSRDFKAFLDRARHSVYIDLRDLAAFY